MANEVAFQGSDSMERGGLIAGLHRKPTPFVYPFASRKRDSSPSLPCLSPPCITFKQHLGLKVSKKKSLLGKDRKLHGESKGVLMMEDLGHILLFKSYLRITMNEGELNNFEGKRLQIYDPLEFELEPSEKMI
ncbi:hypothetical protein SAY86_009992 [Trapa natans]|uniref:Uncharacterized protein n=1 Tax=Trapa natans TaxID=22666 RepID=A0AAN7L5U1_TRANT|nr:hypothetical protein SAY86_009992 [Trapa natans]